MAIERIAAFVAVAETGSIQAAAKRLLVSRATIRRRIEELEAEVGVPLLNRTRSGATTTPAGAKLANHGRPLIQATRAVYDAVRRVESEPSGRLCFAVRPGLPLEMLARMHEDLITRWPAVTFDYVYCDDPHAKLQLDAHIALDLARGGSPFGLESIRIGELPFRLVASRAYLARVGPINDVADLERLTLLMWADPSDDPTLLPTLDGSFVHVEPRVVSNHMEMLLEMARNGAGVAYAPRVLAGPHAAALELVLEDTLGWNADFSLTVATSMRDVSWVMDVCEATMRLSHSSAPS